MKNENINHVCQDCGKKNNWDQFSVSTWYIGICDICKQQKSVTQFRDFFYGRKRQKEMRLGGKANKVRSSS